MGHHERKNKNFFLTFSVGNVICDQFVCVLDPAQKVKPRIPSASLSQSVTVDETVLPAASQNITAYAVNTETSQRYKLEPHNARI